TRRRLGVEPLEVMNRRFLLNLSLALNLLLAVVVVTLAKSRGARSAAGAAPSLTNRVVRVRPATNPPASAVVEVPATFHWSEVESTDYRVYMKNLRAIGCPEATIRDLIIADVDDLFTGRVRRVVESVTGNFWELMANSKA